MRRIRYLICLIFGILWMIPTLVFAADDTYGRSDQGKTDPPRLNVYYHEYARRNIPSSPDNMEREIHSIGSREIKPESEIYLQKNTRILVSIKGEDFSEDRVYLKVYSEDYASGQKKDVTKDYYNPSRWKKSGGGKYNLSLDFGKEGHYQMEISYLDQSGNRILRADATQEACFQDGVYYGPHLAVDSSDPVIESIKAGRKPISWQDELAIYDGDPLYEIIVKEENFHPLCLEMKPGGKMEVSSYKTYFEGGVRKTKLVLTAQKEGIYDLNWKIRDGGGRNKEEGSLAFSLDLSEPQVTFSPDPSVEYRMHPYEECHYFSQKPMVFLLTATDKISGISDISYEVWDKEGKVKSKTERNQGRGDSFTVSIQLEEEDFCGWIQASARDGIGRENQSFLSPVFLWESERRFLKESELDMIFPQAQYEDTSRKISYYNKDILINLKGRSQYAGIDKIYIETLLLNNSRQQREDLSESQAILREIDRTFSLAASEYSTSSGEEPVRIQGGLVDNAGRERKTETYAIVIDKEPPEIEVTYSPSDLQGDQGQKRSVLVRLRDRNLNLSSLQWQIEGPSDGYSLGEWEKKKDTYCCKVDFFGDGRYQMGLSVRDYSGNESFYRDKDAFVIDHKPPELRLYMDQSNVKNKIYYRNSQKIYILIKEDNLDVSSIDLYGGKKAGQSAIVEETDSLTFGKEEYSRRRGWRIFSSVVSEEGYHRILCSCVDRAGNRSDQGSLPGFIIDRTPPMVRMTHIEDGMTYTDLVNPVIKVSDPYLENKGCHIQLFYEDGRRAEELEREMNKVCSDKGIVTFFWNPTPDHKNWDNHYYMRITATDLAGNQFKEERDISFYVDRFGARYVLPESTRTYMRQRYHRQEKALDIEVYSLHPLEEDIFLTRDNEEMIKIDKVNYQAETEILKGDEEMEEEVLPPHREGWYRTIYHISEQLFQREGNYQITMRCREKDLGDGEILTENESSSWMENLEFTIDKTPPTVSIGGLDEAVYGEDRHTYTITAMDNTRLKKVKIHIGKEEGYGLEQVREYKEDDFNQLHSIKEELKSCVGYQTIWYEAWDYAGNHMSSKEEGIEKRVLVTGNSFVRIYCLHPKLSALIFLGGLAMIIVGIFLTRKRLFVILR